jgi:Rrf2 family protein
MGLYGASMEAGLHCLIYLVDHADGAAPSCKDLAEFQGVSPSSLAKVFTKLEKAGIVVSVEGIGGGFRLARPAEKITVLDVADAIEGDKPLFQCRDIRENCVLYTVAKPQWSTRGVCSIHQVMLRAEQKMRAELDGCTLWDLAQDVKGKVPSSQIEDTANWFLDRRASRRSSRL